jgi:hypothetical protein
MTYLRRLYDWVLHWADTPYLQGLHGLRGAFYARIYSIVAQQSG